MVSVFYFIVLAVLVSSGNTNCVLSKLAMPFNNKLPVVFHFMVLAVLIHLVYNASCANQELRNNFVALEPLTLVLGLVLPFALDRLRSPLV